MSNGPSPADVLQLEESHTLLPNQVTLPGPTLLLERGRPVEITIVNQLSEPTAVHWHGMELESYYDGVAGWGIRGHELTPTIAPGQSFCARFTPPRAGTSTGVCVGATREIIGEFVVRTLVDTVWRVWPVCHEDLSHGA